MPTVRLGAPTLRANSSGRSRSTHSTRTRTRAASRASSRLQLPTRWTSDSAASPRSRSSPVSSDCRTPASIEARMSSVRRWSSGIVPSHGQSPETVHAPIVAREGVADLAHPGHDVVIVRAMGPGSSPGRTATRDDVAPGTGSRRAIGAGPPCDALGREGHGQVVVG
jgi:hypothetical protein